MARSERRPSIASATAGACAGRCAPGCPKGSGTLRGWIDELAPGQRRYRGPNPKRDPVPIEKKVQAIAELEARTGPCIWRREIMGDNGGDTERKGVPASKEYDDLPDDIEVLQDMLREAKMQLRRGRHRFHADEPNGLWITDVTEFRIPAGRAYLSPIVDCSGGMPPSWPVSTSPDAEMANPSLLDACRWLNEGDRPKIHSDCGCHYRWPGWIRICDESGLAR